MKLYYIAVVPLLMGASLSDLKVEPEHRCAPYSAKNYSYNSKLDKKFVEGFGYVVDKDGKLDRGFPSSYYHGISFRFLQDMDIEHVVARSEGHDSGLCAYPDRWKEFAGDMENITVAAEHPNRTLKKDRDPSSWLPEIRQCEYARQWIDVKAKYGLTIDQAEHDALANVLEGC